MGFTQNSARSLAIAKRPRQRLPDVTVDAARQLHEDEGWGYRRLARHFGVSYQTVRGWCTYRRR